MPIWIMLIQTTPILIIKLQLENYHGSCQEPPYPIHPWHAPFA